MKKQISPSEFSIRAYSLIVIVMFFVTPSLIENVKHFFHMRDTLSNAVIIFPVLWIAGSLSLYVIVKFIYRAGLRKGLLIRYSNNEEVLKFSEFFEKGICWKVTKKVKIQLDDKASSFAWVINTSSEGDEIDLLLIGDWSKQDEFCIGSAYEFYTEKNNDCLLYKEIGKKDD